MKIQLTFIDWFGIKPTSTQQPPLPTGAAPPYSKQVTTIARAAFDKKTYFAFNFAEILYAPLEIQSQFLLEGWSPAAALAVNAMAQNNFVTENSFGNTELPLTPEEAVIATLVVWCLNFQEIGSPISTPAVILTYKGQSSLVPRKTMPWNQALEMLGGVTPVKVSSSELKSLIGSYTALSVPDAIKSLNFKYLEEKKSPNYSPFEIATDWSFWGMGWNGPNAAPAWRLPVGCFALKAKKKTELLSAPNSKSSVLSILNKGESATQTVPVDKNGWWGAVDNSGKYGYLNSSDVDISPLKAEIVVKQEEEPKKVSKSKTGVYVGIGISAAILLSAALFLRKK